jgi:N6-L-threonylcarbamoyladenine synthase
MRILSIETSCDETGLAIVLGAGNAKNPKIEIVKEVLSSQIKIHAPFGGVVPNLAKREHIRNLPILFKKLMGKDFGDNAKLPVDAIAVTVGPGLEPALWAGIEFAKQLARAYKKNIPIDCSHSFRRTHDTTQNGQSP